MFHRAVIIDFIVLSTKIAKRARGYTNSMPLHELIRTVNKFQGTQCYLWIKRDLLQGYFKRIQILVAASIYRHFLVQLN